MRECFHCVYCERNLQSTFVYLRYIEYGTYAVHYAHRNTIQIQITSHMLRNDVFALMQINVDAIKYRQLLRLWCPSCSHFDLCQGREKIQLLLKILTKYIKIKKYIHDTCNRSNRSVKQFQHFSSSLTINNYKINVTEL